MDIKGEEKYIGNFKSNPDQADPYEHLRDRLLIGISRDLRALESQYRGVIHDVIDPKLLLARLSKIGDSMMSRIRQVDVRRGMVTTPREGVWFAYYRITAMDDDGRRFKSSWHSSWEYEFGDSIFIVTPQVLAQEEVSIVAVAIESSAAVLTKNITTLPTVRVPLHNTSKNLRSFTLHGFDNMDEVKLRYGRMPIQESTVNALGQVASSDYGTYVLFPVPVSAKKPKKVVLSARQIDAPDGNFFGIRRRPDQSEDIVGITRATFRLLSSPMIFSPELPALQKNY